jgi:hypothetical protein
MGLGPPVMELYRQLKLQGAFEQLTEVMELGSQDFWCPQKNLLAALVQAFGRRVDPALLDTSNTSQKPARLLYEALGMKYHCVDVDGRVGSLVMDLNFDSVPDGHKGRYDLITNHGTSEHILNQYNVFKTMHDFARVGSLFIHAVPFTVHLEHGFFNYQPNFFDALARYNSYETLGIWVGPDWQLASFIPWDPMLLDYLAFSSKTTHLLVVAQRKMYNREFCVPFQEIYEDMVPDDVRTRYAMVVDGEVLDGKRVKYLTKDEMLAKEYQVEITGLNNVIASYKGQVDGLKHELATTKYQLDQLRYSGGPPANAANDYQAQLDELKHELARTKQQLEELRSARPHVIETDSATKRHDNADVAHQLLERMRTRSRERKPSTELLPHRSETAEQEFLVSD